jgi:hypothetical protein
MAGMVRGLLQINQLCDNCLVGKQRLSPFSVKEKIQRRAPPQLGGW